MSQSSPSTQRMADSLPFSIPHSKSSQGPRFSSLTSSSVFFAAASAPAHIVLSQQVMMRWRGHLVSGGKNAKLLLGSLLIVLGLLILSGPDKELETILVNVSPAWLTTLTTRL